MGVFNNFPYANFHELNADWIIEQVRKVMDEWEEYRTDMNLWKVGVDDQLAEFQAWFDNLDVQDEVRTVMNELILSGEFIEITSPQIVSATEAWLAAHITPTTPAIDDTLTISGAAADAKVTGDRITDLKEDFTERLQTLDDEVFEVATITKSASYTIPASQVLNTSSDPLRISIPNGTTYKYILTSNDVASGVRYSIIELDANKNNIGSHNAYVGSQSIATLTGNVEYITLYSNQSGFSENDVVTLTVEFVSGGGGENSLEYKVDQLEKIERITSANLLKQSDIVDNEYVTFYGERRSDTNYCHTPILPVEPGDILQSNIAPVRFVTFYSSDGVAIPTSGINNASIPITVPADAYGVILSVSYNFVLNDYWNITVGNDIAPYHDGGAVGINYEDVYNLNSERFETILGNDSIRSELGAIAANTEYNLTTAPRFSKKNVELSFYTKFSSFTGITIGKGFEKYNGKGVRITNTNIILHIYDEGQDIVSTTVAHDVTISNYLSVIVALNDDGSGTVTINSTGGTFSTDFTFNYTWAGQSFVKAEQNGTDAVFTCTTNDLKCPMWFFGDSYLSLANNRIMGQLKNMDYINNIMISALPGLRAWDGPTNDSALREAQRMLAIATPKYIVWCLGMNGSNDSTLIALNWIKHICADRGIELILYTTPSVPSYPHETLNDVIESSGYRYINGYDAVGSQVGGSWYTGYLNNDNVHPTELGAKALASRFLIDAPEIMQYSTHS